jgi:hypothetical protein
MRNDNNTKTSTLRASDIAPDSIHTLHNFQGDEKEKTPGAFIWFDRLDVTEDFALGRGRQGALEALRDELANELGIKDKSQVKVYSSQGIYDKQGNEVVRTGVLVLGKSVEEVGSALTNVHRNLQVREVEAVELNVDREKRFSKRFSNGDPEETEFYNRSTTEIDDAEQTYQKRIAARMQAMADAQRSYTPESDSTRPPSAMSSDSSIDLNVNEGLTIEEKERLIEATENATYDRTNKTLIFGPYDQDFMLKAWDEINEYLQEQGYEAFFRNTKEEGAGEVVVKRLSHFQSDDVYRDLLGLRYSLVEGLQREINEERANEVNNLPLYERDTNSPPQSRTRLDTIKEEQGEEINSEEERVLNWEQRLFIASSNTLQRPDNLTYLHGTYQMTEESMNFQFSNDSGSDERMPLNREQKQILSREVSQIRERVDQELDYLLSKVTNIIQKDGSITLQFSDDTSLDEMAAIQGYLTMKYGSFAVVKEGAVVADLDRRSIKDFEGRVDLAKSRMEGREGRNDDNDFERLPRTPGKSDEETLSNEGEDRKLIVRKSDAGIGENDPRSKLRGDERAYYSKEIETMMPVLLNKNINHEYSVQYYDESKPELTNSSLVIGTANENDKLLTIHAVVQAYGVEKLTDRTRQYYEDHQEQLTDLLAIASGKEAADNPSRASLLTLTPIKEEEPRTGRLSNNDEVRSLSFSPEPTESRRRPQTPANTMSGRGGGPGA